MEEIAVLGIGRHQWGKFPDKTWMDLAEHAVREALRDASVEWKDIQLVSAGEDRFSGVRGLLAGSFLSERLGYMGAPVVHSYNACATGGYTLKTAMAYINSGVCDIALCFGASCSPSGFFRPTQIQEWDPSDLDTQRFRVLGRTNPSGFALGATRRMQLYGATEDDFAQIKVKNSKHGAANPYARYRKAFTREDVFNSPMVAYPLRLLQIAATSDGGAAVVVCSREKAKQYTTKPVILAAVGAATPGAPGPVGTGYSSNISDAAPDTEDSAGVLSSKAAYKAAGIGPEDLSFAEVYDLNPSAELNWYEQIELCKKGEAEGLLRDGATAIGGRIPVNVSGGVSSSGEAIPAQALYQACELVTQMRGAGEGRQVEGAKVGLAVNSGMGGNSSCMIVKR
jgi:acetyl-CoA acetyltransferase